MAPVALLRMPREHLRRASRISAVLAAFRLWFNAPPLPDPVICAALAGRGMATGPMFRPVPQAVQQDPDVEDQQRETLRSDRLNEQAIPRATVDSAEFARIPKPISVRKSVAYRSKVAKTGTWSLGCSQPRASRKIRLPCEAALISPVAQM